MFLYVKIQASCSGPSKFKHLHSKQSCLHFVSLTFKVQGISPFQPGASTALVALVFWKNCCWITFGILLVYALPHSIWVYSKIVDAPVHINHQVTTNINKQRFQIVNLPLIEWHTILSCRFCSSYSSPSHKSQQTPHGPRCRFHQSLHPAMSHTES